MIIGVLCAVPFMLFIFNGHWHGGNLHVEDFGEDSPEEITVLHAHICVSIFSKEMPQEVCFLLTQAGVLEQQEKSRSRGEYVVDL